MGGEGWGRGGGGGGGGGQERAREEVGVSDVSGMRTKMSPWGRRGSMRVEVRLGEVETRMMFSITPAEKRKARNVFIPAF